MIRRITLTNFMSHRHTVIDLADGLNVITGDNNCGKSAIVEALKSVCDNSGKDYVIRHGEKECSVVVETAEGDVIEWKRKKKKSIYIINGREVDRLNRSLPSDLQPLLRLPEVESEQESFDVHFGKQRDPIFLLDRPASRRATFFASSSDAARLLEMQSLHKNKVQDAGGNRKGLLKSQEKLQGRLEKLEPLDSLGPRLASLEKTFAEISDRNSQADLLRDRIRALAQSQTQADHSQAVARAMGRLESPPKLQPAQPVALLIGHLVRTDREINRLAGQLNRLAAIESPPTLHDTASLASLIANTQARIDDIAVSRKLLSALSELKVAPQFEPNHEMNKLVEAIQLAQSRVDTLSGTVDALQDLIVPPPLAEVAPLRKLIEQSSVLQTAVTQRELEMQGIAAAIAEIEQDIRDHADDFEICPTCGQAVDADHLIEELSQSEVRK